MSLHAVRVSFFYPTLFAWDTAPSFPRRAEERLVSEAEAEVQTFDLDTCLRLVAKGEDEAATRLVAHLYPKVIRIVRKRVPSRVPEEDVAQEVFVKMFRKLDQYRGEVPFEHWVAKITVNTCANAMRGRRHHLERRRADLSAAEEAALRDVYEVDREPNPDQLAASRDLLNRLLAHLSPGERLAIETVELEGHSAKEAARILGCGAVALRVRLSRARLKLRRYVEQLNAERRDA